MAEAADTTTTDTATTTDTTTSAATTAAATTAVASTTDTTKNVTTTDVKPDWSEDWRSKMAGGDEKEAKQLDRYASPVDVWKKARSLEQKLSSGELKSTLPDKATPEQLSAWRTENGIPEAPEGYGVEEKDNPAIPGFLKFAHEKNMHPALVKDILEYNKQEVERQKEARDQEAAQLKQETEDTLRKEWGERYRVNKNLITQLLDATAASPELKQDILSTIDMNPDLARWVMAMSNIYNPVATVVPNTGTNVASAIEDEISSIEKLMRENRPEYNKDEKKQQRLRDLYEARDRMKKAA